MNIEHFQNIIAKRDLLQKQQSDKFIFNSFNVLDTMQQIKAIDFIRRLHDFGIPLDLINTNDWNSSPNINVYIGNKVYRRFSDFDFHNAVKNINIPY